MTRSAGKRRREVLRKCIVKWVDGKDFGEFSPAKNGLVTTNKYNLKR